MAFILVKEGKQRNKEKGGEEGEWHKNTKLTWFTWTTPTEKDFYGETAIEAHEKTKEDQEADEINEQIKAAAKKNRKQL